MSIKFKWILENIMGESGLSGIINISPKAIFVSNLETAETYLL